jgi:hypothetical protein
VTSILLVDDQPAHASHYRYLFGEVDACRDYDQLAAAVAAGQEWTAAFVDFDLSGASDEPQRTGLSALRLLMQARPQTRRIVYTTLSDNGRTLYAAAAYHWLKSTIILDKSSEDSALLAAASAEANPTPPAWRRKLQAHAYLIDHIFARYNWLGLWQIWRYYNGSIKAVSDHLPPGNTPTSVREFSEQAADAALNFKVAFHGPNPTTYARANSARATPLVAFADANSKFFNAPDLQDVLEFARPWDRPRSPR